MTAITTQEKLATVKQFNCTGCGASLSVINPRAKNIACQYCGSVLDVNSEEHQILTALGKPDRYAPMSFIRLGMIGNFNGKTYQVIARTRLRMKYKEYWAEEGETGYSNEVWIFDEWLMIDANRTYFYLIEDKEGYLISEEIVPETPGLLPSNLKMSFFRQQSPQIVREYGNAEVIHFEGESNYKITTGDQLRFAMYRDRGIEYSVEWRMADDAQSIKEIEFFREVPISRRKLLEAFSNNEEIEKLKVTEGNWRYVFQVIGGTWLVLLLFLLYSFMGSGKTIYEESFEIQQLNSNTPVATKDIIVSEGGLFSLELNVPEMTQNSEFYAFAYVMDADSGAINTLEGDFYYYAGYEDGESWTEKELSASKVFRLKEPGTYRLELYKNVEDTVLPPTGTIRVEMKQGILLSRYFIIALIILFIPLFIAYSRKGS
ncbi:MAG: hypothetical protein R3D00_29940 [Bacteroidia bacterium]